MLNIRIAEKKDAKKWAEVASAAFRETFGPYNTEEDVQLFIEESLSEEVFLKLISEDHVELWLAEWESELAGYLYCRSKSPKEYVQAKTPFELSRLYILQKFHSKGIGRILMQKVFELAQSTSSDVIWLSVWENNNKAKKFYSHYGFSKVGTQEYPVGKKVDIDEIWTRVLE